MFAENDPGTLTFFRYLLALLIGFAPIAITIAIKIALYRRYQQEGSPIRNQKITISGLRARGANYASRNQHIFSAKGKGGVNRPRPSTPTDLSRNPSQVLGKPQRRYQRNS